jgi:serine/threonine protein phosphatase 1
MIDKIGLDKEKDTLYLLGDYVDWGPDGVGVIQQIMKMQKDGFSIKCLMGNHEKMMLD